MKKYIIRDSKGQKTITYAKNIVDAVSYIKDGVDIRETKLLPGDRIDMKLIVDKIKVPWEALNFDIVKAKVPSKYKNKAVISLCVTEHDKYGYNHPYELQYTLYPKRYKSEADYVKHVEEIKKEALSLVGKSYREEPVKKSKPEKEKKIVSVFKYEVPVFPGQQFKMRDIMDIMWRRFRIDTYSSKKSKVEVFNKDKITVSLNFVTTYCSYILLFTLYSKLCKTEEEFKKYAEDLKEEIHDFSNIRESSWHAL